MQVDQRRDRGEGPRVALRPIDSVMGAEFEESLFREALRAIDDALVIYNAHSVVIYANEAAVRQFGVEIGERLDLGDPRVGRLRIRRRDGSAITSGEIFLEEVLHREGGPQQAERRLEFPNGRKIHVQVALAPVRAADGHVHSAVCTFRDLRPQRKAVEASRGELLRRMAGGIAHDYNNLLTVLLGNLSLARDAARGGGPELQEAMAAIEVAALGAKDLTRQLLAISGADTPTPGVADLALSVASARKQALSDRRVRVDVKIPAGLPSVALPDEVLRQVLEEILVAAGASMPSGGSVRLDAKVLEDAIEVSVQDEGQGFGEHDLQRIFDPYFATWDRGHGLGLASSRAIVEQYGGAIRVESIPGTGTTFTLRLPVRHAPERTPQGVLRGPGRILLMDDDPAVLQVAERMLRRLGHDVVTAVDGDDAVRQFLLAKDAETPVDAAILDLTVPGGTGGEVAARHLQSLAPELVLIVSSGYASGDVLTHYERYGFSSVILKPYRLEELARCLQRVFPGEAEREQPTLF